MLKIKSGFLWFLLSLLTLNISVLFLGKKLKVYKKNAWYTKWYYWILALFFGIVPALIMFFIFIIQINVKVCEKLEVPGNEIYGFPYVWIGSLIVPIVGWTLFIILILYIYVMYLLRIFQGKALKYSN